MFEGKIVAITGDRNGTGRATAAAFERQGATVCGIDVEDGGYFCGDIGDRKTLERFARKVIDDYGRIDFLINNAPPMMKGIDECTYEQFEYALRVGNPDDIAELILFLCSDKATFITGENICIDGGMTRLMIYHGDNGWKLES